MNRLILVLLVLLLAGGGWYFYTNNLNNGVVEPEPLTEEMLDDSMENEPGMEMTDEEEMLEVKIISAEDTLVADLLDVSGGKSFGKGYILREEGMLYHYVTANFQKPPQGNNKYEGWLVKKEPELMFFSTGVMERTGAGLYELLYSSEEENIGYDFVVITEETVVDDTPETHIIEGMAL